MCLPALAFPGFGPLMLLLSLLALLVFLSRTIVLPMQIPTHSRIGLDPRNPDPKDGKPQPPNGITFLGNSQVDNLELWTNKDVDTQHLCYLSGTGGGKTGGLTSQAFVSMIQGSGLSYTDGKAQPDVPIRLASLAHRVGRAHDLLLLNYVSGGRSPWDKSDTKHSNSFSFLYTGSASMVAEMLLSLLVVDNDMWGQRARLYMRAIGYLVTYMRDAKLARPTLKLLIDLLEIQGAMKWAMRSDVPEAARGMLEVYMRNLPDITEDKIQQIIATGQISEEVGRQHGFITMQLVPMLSPLLYEYGEQLSPDNAPDIDMYDVVVSDRILINMLAPLERSAESVASLGRLIVASVKSMMASSMYVGLEGLTEINLDRLPTNADAAYPLFWDEVGYYMVEDHAVKAAQGRSLNFSERYGAQDIAAMKRLGEKEAKATESVLANTLQKLIGPVEDASDTLRLIKERAGQGIFEEQTSLQRQEGMADSYYNTGVSIQRRDKLTMEKIANMSVGEIYVIWRGQVIKARHFFAAVDRVKVFKMNRFVPRPARVFAESLQDSESAKLRERLLEAARPEVRLPKPVDNDDFRMLITAINRGGFEETDAFLRKAHKMRLDEIAELFNGLEPAGFLSGECEEDEDGDAPPSFVDEEVRGGSSGGARPRPAAEASADPIAGQYEDYFTLLFDHLESSPDELGQALESIERGQPWADPAGAEVRAAGNMQIIRDAMTYPRDPTPNISPKALAALAQRAADSIGSLAGV
jgi:intracellular multiplication protein IcmO